ncbi:hypothetical protein Anapl_16475 [Anas platyrhynchos]|uniref:Uncharacterized protein n=1 Tax=Anas platyrhynchos TaxID=8839 RepID=R0L5H8_ANAPL|nr:hypothetical protein Anapl_16475 [Anas platyrhynchos]
MLIRKPQNSWVHCHESDFDCQWHGDKRDSEKETRDMAAGAQEAAPVQREGQSSLQSQDYQKEPSTCTSTSSCRQLSSIVATFFRALNRGEQTRSMGYCPDRPFSYKHISAVATTFRCESGISLGHASPPATSSSGLPPPLGTSLYSSSLLLGNCPLSLLAYPRRAPSPTTLGNFWLLILCRPPGFQSYPSVSIVTLEGQERAILHGNDTAWDSKICPQLHGLREMEQGQVSGCGATAACYVLRLLPQRQCLCELNRAEQNPALIVQVFVKTAGHILCYHRELQAGQDFKL